MNPLLQAESTVAFKALNQHFIKALKALHSEGQGELACRTAASAWAAIRKFSPEEAEKLSGALHFLVRPIQSKKERGHG